MVTLDSAPYGQTIGQCWIEPFNSELYPKYDFTYTILKPIIKTVDDIMDDLESALRSEKDKLSKDVFAQGKRKVKMDSIRKLMAEVDELKEKLK